MLNPDDVSATSEEACGEARRRYADPLFVIGSRGESPRVDGELTSGRGRLPDEADHYRDDAGRHPDGKVILLSNRLLSRQRLRTERVRD
jgi:hypothetical protein